MRTVKVKQTSTLEEYTARWKKFEAAFDRHPIAQEIRRLKLETAELDAELESLGKVSTDCPSQTSYF